MGGLAVSPPRSGERHLPVGRIAGNSAATSGGAVNACVDDLTGIRTYSGHGLRGSSEVSFTPVDALASTELEQCPSDLIEVCYGLAGIDTVSWRSSQTSFKDAS